MKVFATTICLSLLLISNIFADGRSMSLNSELKVVPAPGKMVIDGKDNDWDLSAGVWSYNEPTVVDDYSLWTHLMWDDKGIYFLGRYHDKSPMQNAAAGKDFAKSWKADCFHEADRTHRKGTMKSSHYHERCGGPGAHGPVGLFA